MYCEVGRRAVCAERYKHGSEGGQRFLRVRVAYPTPVPKDTNGKPAIHYTTIYKVFLRRNNELHTPGYQDRTRRISYRSAALPDAKA